MNINIGKFFKWGFIVSLGMVAIGMIFKLGQLIRYFDVFALVFGVLLAIFVLVDLFGWCKTEKANKAEKAAVERISSEENSSEKK